MGVLGKYSKEAVQEMCIEAVRIAAMWLHEYPDAYFVWDDSQCRYWLNDKYEGERFMPQEEVVPFFNALAGMVAALVFTQNRESD